jgi:hypothetical protein
VKARRASNHAVGSRKESTSHRWSTGGSSYISCLVSLASSPRRSVGWLYAVVWRALMEL